jgi:hypothetical protein
METAYKRIADIRSKPRCVHGYDSTNNTFTCGKVLHEYDMHFEYSKSEDIHNPITCSKCLKVLGLPKPPEEIEDTIIGDGKKFISSVHICGDGKINYLELTDNNPIIFSERRARLILLDNQCLDELIGCDAYKITLTKL